MRLLAIVPDIYTDAIKAAVDERKAIAKALCGDTGGMVALDTKCLDGGNESIECAYDAALAAPYVLRMAKQAEEDGYDAVILDCFLDPALSECRELLSIPVFGASQSGCFLAAKLGGEFSVIGILACTDRCIKDNLRRYGLRDFLASIPVVDIPVAELHNDEEALVFKMVEAGYRAVRQDKARALVFGCTSMSNLVAAVRDGLLKRGVDVPVIDPFRAALYDAIGCVLHGISHSKEAYMNVGAKLRKVGWSL